MKIREAYEILSRHNRWRRGADIDMIQPKVLGEAIDKVLERIKVDIEKCDAYKPFDGMKVVPLRRVDNMDITSMVDESDFNFDSNSTYMRIKKGDKKCICRLDESGYIKSMEGNVDLIKDISLKCDSPMVDAYSYEKIKDRFKDELFECSRDFTNKLGLYLSNEGAVYQNEKGYEEHIDAREKEYEEFLDGLDEVTIMEGNDKLEMPF